MTCVQRLPSTECYPFRHRPGSCTVRDNYDGVSHTIEVLTRPRHRYAHLDAVHEVLEPGADGTLASQLLDRGTPPRGGERVGVEGSAGKQSMVSKKREQTSRSRAGDKAYCCWRG